MADVKKTEEPQLVIPPLFWSCRLTITFMCFLASFNALFMTINLGMVIVCLNGSGHNCSSSTTGTDEFESNFTTHSNHETHHSCNNNTVEGSGVQWDKSAQGLLLSATYYGVVSMQLLVGWLCDKYGVSKLVMIIGSTVLGIASVLSPVLIENTGIPFFFAARVIKGAGMASVLSPMIPMLNQWTTVKDQGLLVGLSLAGVGLANAATYPMAGLMCKYSGWKSIFYYAGGFGLAWSVAAIFLVYDTPAKHPRVSVDEKQYWVSTRVKALSKKKVKIPWSQILRSVPVWSIICTNFFFFAATKGTVINLPLFVRDVLDFSVTENGVFSAMPSLVSFFVHLFVGPIFDCVRATNTFSVTTVRKIFHAIGTAIPAIMMFTVSQLPPEKQYVIIGLITIGYSLYEVAWMGGFSFAFLDIAPDYVGVLGGISNTIGLMPGFIMPVIISLLTPEGTSQEWSYVFILFGGLYSLACLIWLVFGSAELQSWGKSKESTKENPMLKSLDNIVI